MNKKANRFLFGAAMIAVLCGCSSSDDNPIRTGVIQGTPIAGLAYSTPTQSGFTDDDGQYLYKSGEAIRFSLGGIEIGSMTAASSITLEALAGLDALPSNSVEVERDLFRSGVPGPLNRLINIAVLLQTLDSDADFSNGISIDTNLGARIDASVVDLDSWYYGFADLGNDRNGLGLRGLLRDAAASNEIEIRAVVTPELALERVYAATPGSYNERFARQRLNDDNADGFVDRGELSEYTSRGKLLSSTFDRDGDGVTDQVWTYTYNDNLRRTSFERDDDADGNVDTTDTQTYDALGTLVSRRTVSSNGDVIYAESITRNSQGSVIQRNTQSTSYDRIEYWTVDADGLRSLYEYDSNADGQIDERSTLSYRPNEVRSDLWIRREVDSNCDGTTDLLMERSFNDDDVLTEFKRDNDVDGNYDYLEMYSYDSAGRIATYALDSDGAGINYTFRTERNADNSRIQVFIDSNADGTDDQIATTVYDDNGQPLIEETDNGANGVVDSRQTYDYNADGKLLQYSSDDNNDGVIDNIRSYSYDATGDLIRTEFDDDNDGATDSVTLYADYVAVSVANEL